MIRLGEVPNYEVDLATYCERHLLCTWLLSFGTELFPACNELPQIFGRPTKFVEQFLIDLAAVQLILEMFQDQIGCFVGILIVEFFIDGFVIRWRTFFAMTTFCSVPPPGFAPLAPSPFRSP